MNFKLFGRCYTCKRIKFFVAKREFALPIGGLKAKSREQFCGSCFRTLKHQYDNGMIKIP